MLLDSYILQCLLLQPETLCTLHVTLSYPDETAKKVMIKEGALPMSACLYVFTERFCLYPPAPEQPGGFNCQNMSLPSILSCSNP